MGQSRGGPELELSQPQLGKQTGSSQRMVAYYEGRPALPPGHALTVFAEVLGTSVDELASPPLKYPADDGVQPRLGAALSPDRKAPSARAQ
jgi:transcriptional regulator with XRE-family HTH domain